MKLWFRYVTIWSYSSNPDTDEGCNLGVGVAVVAGKFDYQITAKAIDLKTHYT